MSERTLKQKTAQGLLWGGISNGIQQLLGLVFGIFLLRTLDETDYGLVGELAIFTGIAGIIINSGFSTALTNKKEATPEDFNAVFWFTVLAGTVLYIILYFCAPWIALYYKEPVLTDLSRFIFLGFLIGGFGTASSTVMFKKLMVKQQAIIGIVSLTLSLIVGLCLALNGYAYWALAVQLVLHTTLISLLSFIFAPWKPTWKIDFTPLKPLLSFSTKLFFTSIFSVINGEVFSVIFGRFDGTKQVGFYTQGKKWTVMGNQFIAGMISAVAQPILVQVNEQKGRQVNVLRKLIRFSSFLSFPLMLGLAFVGREFILIAAGENWLSSVPYLQLFGIWTAFSFLTTLYTNLIFTQGKSNIYMYVTIVVGLLQLAVVFIMYPFREQIGIFPVVMAYLAMNFVSLLIWQYFVHKLIGLRLKDVLKDILPYLGITLGSFFVAWLLTRNIVNLYALFVAKISISAVLYILMLKWSNAVIFKESMAFLLKKQKK